MTRIFTDGAEMGDSLFWDGGGVSISAGGYGGVYYYATQGAIKYFTASSEVYYRSRVLSNQPGANFRVPYIRSGGSEVCDVSYLSGYFHAHCNGNTFSNIKSFASGVWYLIEIYIKIDDSSGRFIVKIDGNTVVDFSGDTKPGTITTVDNIYYGSANGGDYFAMDDLAINNTDNSDGKNDNSWCGDGIVVRLAPSGSSATTNNWLNSGSVSGSANYLYVDEYPADGNTTYTYASASSTGLQTQFALSNFTIAGTTITRVFAEGRAKKTSANSYGVKIGDLASGGTDVMSGSQVLSVGAYTRILGNEQRVNPVTSASWTTADVNGLELVLEIP
jgi:hypothetical protein